MKKSSPNPSPRNAESSTQYNSPRTPLRDGYLPRSDDRDPPDSHESFHSPENSLEKHPTEYSRAVVITDNSSPSPVPSPLHDLERPAPPEFMVNLARREDHTPSSMNFDRPPGPGRAHAGRGRGPPAPPTPAGSKKEAMVTKAALGFRLSEAVLCLISFSVMAADKTQGWSGDSFDRYKEYRYCLTVNVIAFAYAAFQACDLASQLVTGNHIVNHHLRCHFDFFMDQVLAYLLISASSSAATRVDDWQSNWGKDEFTEMASASVGLSFLAFIAFAISSLISGYNLSAVYP